MESCPVTQGAQPAMFNDNLEGWDGVGGGQQVQEEGGIYIYTLMADSHCCTAETNTTL